ncbi:hypothetical protein V2J09_012121 [Rumex salicifolius]
MTEKQWHLVLIHGITGGAWCWFKVKCQLEAFGCHVTCLDLKSCGTDPTHPSAIDTFDQYNQPLHDFMASLPEDHKVILVGHSAGGSQESNPTCFKKIFVPEFIPPISSSEDFALMKILSRPAPIRAIVASKIMEDETRESEIVPRVYIKTNRDRVLKPNQQNAMIQRWTPSHVYSVEADHDILFTDPTVLSGLLIGAFSSLAI